MKSIYGILLVTLIAFVAFTASYPNSRSSYGYDDTGRDLSPYEERQSLVDDGDYNLSAGQSPNSDTDAGPSFDYNPLAYSPLSDFIQRMQAMMKRVQSQMGQVLSRMPPQNIDWAKLGNTTSHTKIVNGHVVTINETTYKNEDEDSSSVVRILVHEVKPTNSNQKVFFTPTTTESDYTSEYNNPQTEDLNADIDRNYQRGSDKFKRQDRRQHVYLDPRFVDSVDNSVDVFEPSHPIDLARDTRVNDLMRDNSKGGLVMIDPDAELIEVQNGHVRRYSPSRHFYNQQRQQPIFN